MLRSWPILLLAAARSSWAVIGMLAVVLVAWRSVVWLRTTYSVDADGLVVHSGLLWQNTQVVPPQRVQQVELRRSLRHRVLGLAVVRVGLAGGGDTTEVALDALGEADAARLSNTLDRWRSTQHEPGRSPATAGTSAASGASASSAAPALGSSGPFAPPPVARPAPVERHLLAVTTGQLVVAGLTSRSLWLAPLAALAAFAQLMSDARLDDGSTDAIRSTLADASPAMVIAGVMMLSLLAASISTVVRNHGLTVTRSDDDIVVRRGVLEQRSATVPLARVQLVEVATHVGRRHAELASMEVRTADLGGNAGAGERSTSIPIGGRADLDALVHELLPAAELHTLGDLDELRRHPPGAVRRAVVRRTLRLVPAGVVVGLVVGGLGLVPGAIGAAIGLVVAVPTGWITGRSLRSGWTTTAVVTQRGAISWRRWIVPVSRVQSVGLVQNPFQRRLGLATVRLDVAGAVGGVTLHDLAVADAVELADDLGLTARAVTVGREHHATT